MSERAAPEKALVTAKVLGPLAAAVMGILWRRSRASVGEIEADLNAARGKTLSYKTVLTICTRLETRGLLAHDQAGRAYHYRPLLTEKELLAREARRQVSELMERFGDLAISGFLDELGAAPGQLARLAKILGDEIPEP